MKDLRCFLAIDSQNLFYTAKNLGLKIEYQKIWDLFKEREKIIKAVVYVARTPAAPSLNFENVLKEIGFEIRLKHVEKIEGEFRFGDWDVGIAMDAVRFLGKFDKFILMSGDGDFSDLFEFLREKGKKTEVWSFERSFSKKLLKYVDSINFLGKDICFDRSDDETGKRD